MADGAPGIAGIDHLVLTVADIETSLRFYTDVLGLGVETFRGADGAERRALRLGAQKINLHEAGAEIRPHAAEPRPGSTDLCLLSAAAPEDWLARLSALGVPVELGPVPRTGAMGPVVSIYLRDPDGNLIEIARPG